MLERWRRPKEDLWIWPGVSWIWLDSRLVGALVYRSWCEMFWGEHLVVPLVPSAPILSGRFWDTTFFEPGRVRLTSSWSGQNLTHTYPGGPRDPDEHVEMVSMRSLHLFQGMRMDGQARDLRASHKGLLEQSLEESHQQWLVARIDSGPSVRDAGGGPP